jgi:hypothetical protein
LYNVADLADRLPLRFSGVNAMADDNKNRELAKRQETEPVLPVVRIQPVRTIQLGRQHTLDVTNLAQREQDALEAQAHRNAIDRDDREQRIAQDLIATAGQIRTFTDAVADTAAQNAAVTITNTKDDALGRTEMMFGNTDAARAGKLSRSQQGLGDNAKFWICLAVIAGIVIVLVAAFKH